MKIAISGAGIAGPTLAYWLLRGGHAPTLIEQAPRFRTGGYVVDFWGAGYEVARRMGLEETIRAAGYQVQRLVAVGDDGRMRATMSTDSFARVAGGRFTSVPRGDLARILYDSVQHRIESVFGDSIVALEPHADGVRVAFEQGAEREFDLVIGADGLHSNVRRLAFGPQAAFERFLGYHVAVFVAHGYPCRDVLEYVVFNRPGAQVGRFTLRGDRTMFVFVFASSADAVPADLAGRKALLRTLFAGSGWELPAILDALDACEDLYFDRVSQIVMPQWSQGRVALVGDAAACVSLLAGEGTGLAMTEAYVLAGELLRADGDHRRAFPAYEARLRALVQGKQKGAHRLARWFAPRTRPGIWLRNQALRLMDVGPVGRILVGRGLRDDVVLPTY